MWCIFNIDIMIVSPWTDHCEFSSGISYTDLRKINFLTLPRANCRVRMNATRIWRVACSELLYTSEEANTLVWCSNDGIIIIKKGTR
jgi:hypothetical protein